MTPFSDRKWAQLDTLTVRVFASLELKVTLEAIVGVFVPEVASSAFVTLADAREYETAMLAPPGIFELSLPLATDGMPVGTLFLHGITNTDVRFLRTAADRCSRALSNARRYEHERNVALTFQHAALISELPTDPRYRFDAVYEAGRSEAKVGGDWYDAFRLPDGRFVVSIGDVVGSGLGAAVAMVNVRQTIRGVAQINADPGVMLQAAERTLRAQHPERFVTAFVAVVDPVTQNCTYANAGHPRPYVRQPNGAVVQLAGAVVPLGLELNDCFDVRHCALEPGSTLVMYTDGLIESTHDVLYGEGRLEEVLRDPALLERSRIAQYIHDGVLADAARDDVAIMVVSVASAVPVKRWRFVPRWHDVSRRVQREIGNVISETDFPSERMSHVELVFAEALANALKYAPGTIEVILETQPGRIVVHVLDHGPGFQFNPHLPSDLYTESGRGVFLIAQLADLFTVEQRPGGGSHARIVFFYERTDE